MSGPDYEELLGRQLYGQERFADAEAAFRLALAKNPGSARVYLSLALCIDVAERADEALLVFQRAAQLDASLADAHNGVGICESALERAEAAFRKAIVLEPESAEFHANLAYCLLRQERQTDAEPCLRQAARLEPRNLAIVCDWGELLIDLNRYRDAEALLNRAISRLPARKGLLDPSTWRHYEARRFDQAEERFARLRAPGAVGEEAWLYSTLARTRRAQQRLGDAIDAAKVAVALNPRAGEFHGALGKLFEESRRPDEAGAAYQRERELSRT